MNRERCECGHNRGAHLNDRDFCTTDKCMNVCHGYRPIMLPGPGERPVFGKHRIPPRQAWTPEPLSECWDQDERWDP